MEISTPNKKLDSLLSKSFAARVNNLPSAIKMAHRVINRCALNYDDYHQAFANCYLGYYYMILSDYDKSKSYTEKAIQYFEQHKIDSGLGMCYYTLGSIMYKTDNYHEALKFLLESYEIFKTNNDLFGQVRSLKSIGSIYEFFEDYNKAEDTYSKCLRIAQRNKDTNGLSNIYNPLSGLYLKKGEIDLAENTILKSIRIKKANNDKRGLAYAYYGQGKVCLAKLEYKKAERLLRQSKSIHQEMGEQTGLMMALNKLGVLYFGMGYISDAKSSLHESIVLAEKSDNRVILFKAHNILYQIAKSEDKAEEALNHLEKNSYYKDLVIKKDTKSVIASIQALAKTELIEKEATWQKAINKSIEKKSKELDTFVYKVAHDLRGPISSLMGLYNLVDHEVKDEKSLEYFNIYNTEINRLNNIVLDFINVTQIKEKKLERERIDFNSMVDEVINSYRYLENFDHIKFKVEIDKKLDLFSDKSTVNTIIQNLLENAVKYSKPDVDGLIHVKIYGRKNDTLIQVSDSGIGIRKQDQNKIFGMFFRANNELKGTGLGLYLLKSAVEKLSGKINFSSIIQEGTIFKISIPYS
ncbi:MAG: tetratricopeptide repeat protein [Reichenbachiella sp.]